MKAGSLCMGIGGLDLAAEAHFGCELAWYSEVEPAPCTVLEREWPGVPNLGDLTAVDWSTVEPVVVLTAGYPCQPFSHAGKRKGQDDERHLWPYVAEAVRVLRPRWVVLENVAGHLTLGFGDVLRDLAEAGFDAEWCVLRASDVGAPHQRARLFIVATDARAERWDGRPHLQGARRHEAERGQAGGHAGDGGPSRSRAAPDATHVGHERGGSARGRGTGPADSGGAAPDAAPDADIDGLSRSTQLDGSPAGRLDRPHRRHADGRGVEAARRTGMGADEPVAWGRYEPAIRRWEHLLGRPAPRPTDDRGRLSPPFVEWLMGYPEGWVDGLTRTQALKALGNAVVPQQGLAALSVLAPVMEVAA